MRANPRITARAALWMFAASTLVFPAFAQEGLEEDQEVLFFPAPGALAAGNGASLKIQGRIFEPVEESTRLAALVAYLKKEYEIRSSDAKQLATLRERARFLLSDSEGRTSVSVKLGDKTISLPASNFAGYFADEVQQSEAEVSRLARKGEISFESLPTDDNPKRFRGAVVLVPEEVVMVVTDMDDTLKVTEVCSRKESLKNTLLRPFVPAPGMAALYRSWQQALGTRIHFHVVSAGPWQLYEPLRRFTEDGSVGFPPFTWDMRPVDITNPFALVQALKADPLGFKVEKIKELLNRFPKRRFILVGDSGEKDPEVYAKIVEDFPDRVDGVFIRDVSDKCPVSRNYATLFPGKAAEKLKVFRNPTTLPAIAGGGNSRPGRGPR